MNQTFPKKNALKKHMFNVHEKCQFICEDHCGRKFTSLKYLNQHLKRV